MAAKIFDFEAEFRLGIDQVDNEHIQLVDMLNAVYALIAEGKRDEARQYFSKTLSNYVNEHFAHEEQFMEEIGYPELAMHRKTHENFKATLLRSLPSIEAYDEKAFRDALWDAFTWIVNHIGKTDKKICSLLSGAGQGVRTDIKVRSPL